MKGSEKGVMVRGPNHDTKQPEGGSREINLRRVPTSGEDRRAVAVGAEQKAKGLFPVDDAEGPAGEDVNNLLKGWELLERAEGDSHIIRIGKTAGRNRTLAEKVRDATGGARVGAEKGEKRLDGHQIKEGGEGAALPNPIPSAGERTQVAIKVKADAVVIIEHGDEGSKGGVETESKDDLPKETPINAVIGFGLIHGNEHPVRVRLIAVETELLDEERDIARKLTRAEAVLIQIHNLMDVTRQTGSDGAGKDTVQRAKDGNGTEVIQTVESSGPLVDKRDKRGVELPKEAIISTGGQEGLLDEEGERVG